MTDRRQEILDTALALADEGGLGAVTMRAVAQRLGVTAMALYPHVSSKDDLLDGLVGRLLTEAALPGPGLPWQQRLRVLASGAREIARRHPSLMPLLFTRPAVTPDSVRVVEAIYQALLDAGVPPPQVPRLERLVSTVILGFAISEAAGRFSAGSTEPRERRRALPAGELPAHTRLAEWLDAAWSLDEEFEADLADLAAMISAVAGAR
jgi:AcrR family transcriptional regulator